MKDLTNPLKDKVLLDDLGFESIEKNMSRVGKQIAIEKMYDVLIDLISDFNGMRLFLEKEHADCNKKYNFDDMSREFLKNCFLRLKEYESLVIDWKNEIE